MTTQPPTPTTLNRVIKVKTNLNNKFSSLTFCHIQIAGDSGIPESVAQKTHFRFIFEDRSHEEVNAQIINSVRQPLHQISEAFTLLSHNMTKEDFIQKVLKEVPGIQLTTEMVVYFYKSIAE